MAPVCAGAVARHGKRVEMPCASLGAGCGAGVPSDISSELCPGGLQHLPPEHRRCHRAVTSEG